MASLPIHPDFTKRDFINRSLPNRYGSSAGSALIITLLFTILLSIVLVGYVTTAGIERKSTQSHYGKVQAQMYSNMATEVVASRIAKATTITKHPTTKADTAWWISQPGRIAYTPFATNGTVPTTELVDLSSGKAASVQEDISVNLNPASLTQSEGLIKDDATDKLPVKWVYVRKDGTQIFNPTTVPAYSTGSTAIVGRYAFWTDDESSRINVNTAASSKTPATEIAAHPAKIDLEKLSPLTTDDVKDIRNTRDTRPFNSLEEVKSVDDSATIKSALKENKQLLTYYNHSSDLNRFGDSKIVLTTQKSLAGGRPFLDILSEDNTDPGDETKIDKKKLEELFVKLYGYFSKRACDWGLINTATSNLWNKTMVLKYTDKGAAQTILNIIEYVRSVESAHPLVLPIRGAFPAPLATPFVPAGNFAYKDSSGNNSNSGSLGMLGNSRRLHVVEIGIWLADAPTAPAPAKPSYNGKLKLRLYLPETAGSPVALDGTDPVINVFYSIYPLLGVTAQFTGLSSYFDITAADVIGSATIRPGEYRTISKNITIPYSTNAAPDRITGVRFRTALRQTKGPSNWLSYDIAPVHAAAATGGQDIVYMFDPAGTAEANIKSLSVDDPAINQSYSDWQKLGPNKFGTQDPPFASTLNSAPTSTTPQQDTNAQGNLTSLGTRPPYPKGSTQNPLGIVQSVAELGRVHTGGKGTSVSGTPWRTLRLQPRTGTVNSMLPDWLLLDLFTVPIQPKNAADAAVLRPIADTAAGRININANAHPFTAAEFHRDKPLRLILQTAQPTLNDGAVTDVISNIFNKTLATSSAGNGFVFGTTDVSGNQLYSMPGEIFEIKGIADTGEESEANAQKLFDHLTTNGNVFSVFTVGQKVIQLPNGKFKVLSESRSRTLLERQNDGEVRAISTTELGL